MTKSPPSGVSSRQEGLIKQQTRSVGMQLGKQNHGEACPQYSPCTQIMCLYAPIYLFIFCMWWNVSKRFTGKCLLVPIL